MELTPEKIDEIQKIVLSIVAFLTSGGVITMIATLIFKHIGNKLITKINLESATKQAIDKAVGRLQEISFTQTVQPIAKQELEKITETANKYIEESMGATDKKIDALIEILEAFSAYFENSIAVSEDQKKRLKEAFDVAKGEHLVKPEPEKTVITVKVAEEPKQEEPVAEVKKTTVVR